MKKIVGMCPYPSGSNWEKSGNPCLHEIKNSIESNGWQVVPINLSELANPSTIQEKGVEVIHLHWASACFDVAKYKSVFIPHFIGTFFSTNKSFYLTKVYSLFIKLYGRILDHTLSKYLVKKAKTDLKKWSHSLKSTGIPIVWQQHDLLSHGLKTNYNYLQIIDELLHLELFKLSKAIVVHEKSCLKPIKQHYGSSKKYALAFVGPTNYGEKKTKDQAMLDLKITDKNKIFSYIGTGRKNRNPQSSIEKFFKYAGDKDLFIAAGQNIKKFIPSKYKQRILIFNGFQEASLIRDIYCASDFIINDSDNYLTSAVLRNALTYGVPSICYSFGSAIDMLENAAIFIGREVNSLDNAIKKALMLSKQEYELLKVATLQRNEERSWSQNGPSLTKLYDYLISDKKAI